MQQDTLEWILTTLIIKNEKKKKKKKKEFDNFIFP